jgi:hypothetical protein
MTVWTKLIGLLRAKRTGETARKGQFCSALFCQCVVVHRL